MPLHIETPLIEAGQSAWLKMEALQPPGSFKIRGIGHACETYVQRGARRFISSSGGNAGIAAAYAGRELGVPVVVVVPETASERARELIRLQRAEVIVHGASFQEANTLARSMVTPTDAFIHPFDDPLLWEGHASMIDEVARAGVKPGAVILSVGGGGLMCGVITGLRRNGWHDVPVIAVETEGAASLARSIEAGQRIELPAITSIATSLGARQVAGQAYAWTREHDVRSRVVSDKTAVAACLRFYEEHGVVVEPACGASLALLYEGLPVPDTLVIACGGVTATLEQLHAWR